MDAVSVMNGIEKTQKPRKITFIARKSAEGGYRARAIGWSIFTEAGTLQELREHIRDAVLCHFGEPASRPKRARLLIVREARVKFRPTD